VGLHGVQCSGRQYRFFLCLFFFFFPSLLRQHVMGGLSCPRACCWMGGEGNREKEEAEASRSSRRVGKGRYEVVAGVHGEEGQG